MVIEERILSKALKSNMIAEVATSVVILTNASIVPKDGSVGKLVNEAHQYRSSEGFFLCFYLVFF